MCHPFWFVPILVVINVGISLYLNTCSGKNKTAIKLIYQLAGCLGGANPLKP